MQGHHLLLDCNFFSCEQKLVDDQAFDEDADADEDELQAMEPIKFEEGNLIKLFSFQGQLDEKIL